MNFGQKKSQKKRFMEAPSKRGGGYDATKLPPEVREAIAKVTNVVVPSRFSMMEWQKILDEAGFAFGRSTLYDYKASVSEGGTPLSKEKATGRQRVLDEEEQMILCGFFFGATKKMCSN
jgi:hypothetical protein